MAGLLLYKVLYWKCSMDSEYSVLKCSPHYWWNESLLPRAWSKVCLNPTAQAKRCLLLNSNKSNIIGYFSAQRFVLVLCSIYKDPATVVSPLSHCKTANRLKGLVAYILRCWSPSSSFIQISSQQYSNSADIWPYYRSPYNPLALFLQLVMSWRRVSPEYTQDVLSQLEGPRSLL